MKMATMLYMKEHVVVWLISQEPVDNKTALGRVMVWRRTSLVSHKSINELRYQHKMHTIIRRTFPENTLLSTYRNILENMEF